MSRHIMHYIQNHDSLISESGSANSVVRKPEQARLHQAMLALDQPILLVSLPEALNLSLLAQGMQADICDHSLERIGRIARACRREGLQANMYWQPLAVLSLPGSYANIVLAPRSWQALRNRMEARLVHEQLLAHLKAEGQLRLLLANPTKMQGVGV